MCGRYNFTVDTPDEKMAGLVRLMERRYPGRYRTGEIFPGDTAPGIVETQGKIVPVPATFGFPGFGDGWLLINARAETAAEKKTFAVALKESRIILPSTGFYELGWDEWKTKYLFTVEDRTVLYLCGICRIIDGQMRFVILTRPANGSMIATHDRMPVTVRDDEVRDYLTDWRFAQHALEAEAPALVRRAAEDADAR